MFDYFLKVARRSGEKILDGKPVGLKERLLYALGDVLCLRAADATAWASPGSASPTRPARRSGRSCSASTASLGINLKQLYGQTEASVYITLQPDGEIYADTVGKPGPDVEIAHRRLAARCSTAAPGVFLDYYKDDEATRETKTPDGWVHTGDAGFIDQHGHLKIIDRAKDVGRLSDGDLFAPKYLENKLKFYPEIRRRWPSARGGTT